MARKRNDKRQRKSAQVQARQVVKQFEPKEAWEAGFGFLELCFGYWKSSGDVEKDRLGAEVIQKVCNLMKRLEGWETTMSVGAINAREHVPILQDLYRRVNSGHLAPKDIPKVLEGMATKEVPKNLDELEENSVSDLALFLSPEKEGRLKKLQSLAITKKKIRDLGGPERAAFEMIGKCSGGFSTSQLRKLKKGLIDGTLPLEPYRSLSAIHFEEYQVEIIRRLLNVSADTASKILEAKTLAG